MKLIDFKRWFNYIFKRNPFLNQEEEERYVRKIFAYQNAPFENWLLTIKSISKKNYFYIKMKSRNNGYIFEKKEVIE